jgi:hypothetical protein
MLFSYLLLGLVLGSLCFVLGLSQDVWQGAGIVFPVTMYFLEVTVRGFTALIKHHRLNYQLIDLGAFLLSIAIYVVTTSFDQRLWLPALIVDVVVYFFITYWASRRVPMAPPRDWGNWIPGLPPLWRIRLNRRRPDASITG